MSTALECVGCGGTPDSDNDPCGVCGRRAPHSSLASNECVQIGDAIYCQCGNPSAHYGTMGERGARVVKCEPPPRDSLTSKSRLTRDDELFIATRLMARARHSSKKIANANGKPLHPELMKQLHEDVAECTRLALLLQSERDFETKEESEPASCQEIDGCPTEMAVLKRFWREHQSLPITLRKNGWSILPTHDAANAFWQHWRENGETHKHGYYESTWGAINRALRAARVVPERCGSGLGYQGQFLVETQCTLIEGHSGPHQYASDPRVPQKSKSPREDCPHNECTRTPPCGEHCQEPL